MLITAIIGIWSNVLKLSQLSQVFYVYKKNLLSMQ